MWINSLIKYLPICKDFRFPTKQEKLISESVQCPFKYDKGLRYGSQFSDFRTKNMISEGMLKLPILELSGIYLDMDTLIVGLLFCKRNG